MLERIENDWPGRNSVISAAPVLENGHLLVPTGARSSASTSNEAAIARHPSERNVSIAGGGYEPVPRVNTSTCKPGFVEQPISAAAKQRVEVF
jgi:hypothetical protein